MQARSSLDDARIHRAGRSITGEPPQPSPRPSSYKQSELRSAQENPNHRPKGAKAALAAKLHSYSGSIPADIKNFLASSVQSRRSS